MVCQKPYRVLLINEAQPYANALKDLIVHQTDLTVCGQVTAESELLTAIQQTNPQLVLLESYMPSGENIKLGKSILNHFPILKLILITFYHNLDLLAVAKRAGFQSYVSRDRNPGEVLRSIRTVMIGQPYFNLDAMQTYQYDGDEFTRRLSLTFREIEYIRLIREGLSMREISIHFLVEPETIRLYRGWIYEKLGINKNAELVQFAIRHNL